MFPASQSSEDAEKFLKKEYVFSLEDVSKFWHNGDGVVYILYFKGVISIKEGNSDVGCLFQRHSDVGWPFP